MARTISWIREKMTRQKKSIAIKSVLKNNTEEVEGHGANGIVRQRHIANEYKVMNVKKPVRLRCT